MVGAENAYWVGAVREVEAADDPLRGWRRGRKGLTALWLGGPH